MNASDVPKTVAGGSNPQPLQVPTTTLNPAELHRLMLEMQRLEAVGRLSGGVIHDFNNLLTVILGTAEIWYARSASGSEMREDMREIRKAAERASELTRHLVAYSRPRLNEPSRLNLGERLNDMERLLRRLVGEDIKLTIHVPAGLGSVMVDPGQFDQLLVHLVDRARESMLTGGSLDISAENLPGMQVEVRVTDSGPPIPAAELSTIFEPRHGMKAAGTGTGLGLALCLGIAHYHGGSISVESRAGLGTVFRLRLPAAPASKTPAFADRDSSTQLVSSGHETILFIEDDAAVRRTCSTNLRSHGYVVLEAANAAEAVRLAESAEAGTIRVLVSDLVLPDLSGRAAFQKLRAIIPGLAVLFISGYPDDSVQMRGVGTVDGPVLAKPFSPNRLARRVRSALDGRFPAPGRQI